MPTAQAEKLLAWYAAHHRDLPWRRTTDPYAIWIAEIMLQQTRVESVIPYYQRWLELFPDIQPLAKSAHQDVLIAWEGLGYYARARNIYKTAQILSEQYNGLFPHDIELIRSLPGIGAASAADIASIAFGVNASAVDGNIRRVVARLANLTNPLSSDALQKAVEEYVGAHLPAGRAGDYNQAWMDLGATICLPVNPRCEVCPLADYCLAREKGIQSERPVRAQKPMIPTYEVAAGILVNSQGKVLITRRPEKGLLGGLWEFPGGKRETGEDLTDALQRELHEELDIEVDVLKVQKSYRHAYTHFKVVLTAYFCAHRSGEFKALGVQDLAWVEVSELKAYPMGKIDRMISKELAKHVG